MKTNIISKEYWLERFGEAYQLKWKAAGKSQEAFANAINAMKERNGLIGTCSPQQVSKWRRSTIPSQENIALISELLDLPEDYFEPSREDLYRKSSKYITEVGKRNAQAAEKIGLDLDLVKSLSKLADFDKNFPTYAPLTITSDKNNVLEEVVYGRMHLADSAPIDKALEFMQVTRNGSTITLNYADLCFLKEVQDQVADYVRYLLYRRAELMDNIVEKVNSDCHGSITIREDKLAERDAQLLKGIDEIVKNV